ncbi:aspartate ammonia-lyase [Actinomycetaceae bacterium UMB8039B]|uniref:aspartate ammonia-lyase n=1 Tax=unclassified Pauljensenia TaxID=2908895 RepID=UPI0015C99D97|nr:MULTISPECIES: aspartate ammonia-lyase [unclassified Pauljensenia]MDK7779966.1 aspartate ammonia-lyase [Actinomycetaceae bacterium UMB8041B]MDK8293318.1 aspartate ammonia-lyase [Actinomycetaceae bacterium UMB8039B]MDK8607654.1 aspartate ammonia-lyase [Actinomycetaceae bacterium UMB8041A]MDK8753000.1 aspartate ammonia-lyase [Actinomycetaceae bacterium UMB8039A]MDK6829733.1 aspartate ammonia-lyase [Pauljensenia sp. UMB8040A]
MRATKRIEEDLLGAREVPLEVYWGIHTLRAIENYQISGSTIAEEPEFVRGMVAVKKASAMANRKLGTLSDTIADAIIWACDEILEDGRCLDQFPIDVFQGGAGTSVNMNTNEVVANLALEHLGYAKGRYAYVNPNDHVNKSQSTNDAYPTGFRLGLYKKVDDLVDELERLIESFTSKGLQFRDVIKMGRTQLQDAVPMSLGKEFEAFSVLLGEEIPRLRNNSALLLEVNLGATAIGTGLNTPDGYQDTVVHCLREVTGLPIRGADNLLEATSDTGAYVSMHASIKRLAVKLSKICNDLRLLSSGPRAGLGEIRLPERAAGSSIMPAKVNPVIPEVVNQVCFKVMGNDVALTFAAEAGQLQLNVMEPVIGQTLFESINLLTNAIRTLRELCVIGIEANEDVCRNNVLNSIGIVTYLNEVIGHANGDAVGRECARSGRNVREVVLEMGLLDEAALDELLSVENLLRPKYRDMRYYSGGDPSVVELEDEE